MRTFAGIPAEFASYDGAAILLQSIPYDGTSTWGKGADMGFSAFLEAADNMELYDIETDSEVYRKGIHILPVITENSSPEAVFSMVYKKTTSLLNTGKFLTFFGGEHAISIGVIKAFYEHYEQLTVLQLDAHADLRPSYDGTPYNHACAMHDASLHTNLIQVGIRSMDVEELPYLNRGNCFFAHQLEGDWAEQVLKKITGNVYVTIDLDAFDPAIMPATGTPEPGGMQWNSTMRFLKRLFEEKEVKGFDITELAPIENIKAPNFLAAKLYYKLLSYKFKYHE